jgi:hypothetical protein
MMKKTARMPIRVVFYRDESDKAVWIAHCLEFDLLGHGETRKKAMRMLAESVAIQIQNSQRTGNYANLFNPAPAEFQMMFAQGRDSAPVAFDFDSPSGNFEIGQVEARLFRNDVSGKKKLSLA